MPIETKLDGLNGFHTYRIITEPIQYDNAILLYRAFPYKDEVALFYFYNGNPYTGKMTSLYWIDP